MSPQRGWHRHAHFHSENTAMSRWTAQSFGVPIGFMLHFTITHIPLLDNSNVPTTLIQMQLTSLQSIVEIGLKNVLNYKSSSSSSTSKLSSWFFSLIISAKIKKKRHWDWIHESANLRYRRPPNVSSPPRGSTFRYVLHHHVFSAHIFLSSNTSVTFVPDSYCAPFLLTEVATS